MFTDWPLAFALAVFLVVWSGALLFAIAQRRASWADPVIQFLVFFALFTLPLPIRALITKEIEGDVTKHLPLLIGYLPASVLLATFAIICFIAAYYARTGAWLAHRIRSTRGPRRDPYWAAIGIGAFSLFLIGRLAQNSGGILNFILLGYGSSAETFEKGYLAIGVPWLYVALCFLLYRYAVRRRRLDLLLYTIGFGTIASAQMVLGNRSIVLYMILVTASFLHFAVRRLSLLQLLPLAGGAFIALNVAGFLRASHYASPADLLRQWQEGVTRVATSDIDRRHGWYYTLTTGEFVVPFETMPQMVRSVGTEIPPKWGSSFAVSPLFFVPSVLYASRPLPLGNWYMQQFYGDEKFGRNQGRGFYFLAEGYLNFGPLGVALLASLWGVLWRAAREYLTISQYAPGAVLLYALALAYMFRLIAGDSTTLLVGVAEQDLVPAILGLGLIGAWRHQRRRVRVAVA